MDNIKKCKNNKIICTALVLAVVFIILPFAGIDRNQEDQDTGSVIYYNEIKLYKGEKQ